MSSIEKYVDPSILKCMPYQPGKPIEETARELGIDPASIIKMASNECPLGPAPRALKAMRKYLREMQLYPDGGAYYLKKKLSEKIKLPENNFILGNGSNEILEFISLCLLKPGASAVMSQYAFVVYKILASMHGAEAVEVPADGLGHNLMAMLKAIKPGTRVVYICNPNNPTGTMVGNRQINAFMKKVPDDVLVVFDEAYVEICPVKAPDTLKYVREGRNVIVLRTFSKAYGLAGLRVGYGIAKPELINILEKVRQPFNVNRMAQLAATAALSDVGFVRKSKKLYKEGARKIADFCNKRKIAYEPTFTNFMLIKVGDGASVFKKLEKKGVIVRPMGPYGLNEWIRVSLGTEEENLRFINELGKIL
ncbi:MAG: histidinol-phosphate transaminase [Lentisphaerae bacterium GWF2_45_14]|nr:MAG: histidinol-phosphate transaminase [Lentisphaerae bacterium GWF2_45_14]